MLIVYFDQYYHVCFKVGYNYLIIFQYYYLNTCSKILKFYVNFEILFKKK